MSRWACCLPRRAAQASLLDSAGHTRQVVAQYNHITPGQSVTLDMLTTATHTADLQDANVALTRKGENGALWRGVAVTPRCSAAL